MPVCLNVSHPDGENYHSLLNTCVILLMLPSQEVKEICLCTRHAKAWGGGDGIQLHAFLFLILYGRENVSVVSPPGIRAPPLHFE